MQGFRVLLPEEANAVLHPEGTLPAIVGQEIGEQDQLFLGVLVMELREWRRKLTLRLRGGTLVPRTSSLRYNQRQPLDQDHQIIQHVSLTDFSCAELVFNLN
nr:hypothetical protein Iba_chr12fCG10330 [Ipomoea batatas]